MRKWQMHFVLVIISLCSSCFHPVPSLQVHYTLICWILLFVSHYVHLHIPNHSTSVHVVCYWCFVEGPLVNKTFFFSWIWNIVNVFYKLHFLNNDNDTCIHVFITSMRQKICIYLKNMYSMIHFDAFTCYLMLTLKHLYALTIQWTKIFCSKDKEIRISFSR